jgi:hypothetical protein
MSDSESGQFLAVRLAEDTIVLQGGVDDLADDLGVRLADNKPIPWAVVLSLILSY